MALLDANFGAWPDRKSHSSDRADGGAMGTKVRLGAGLTPNAFALEQTVIPFLLERNFAFAGAECKL